jgi:hypothetical protein
MVQTPKLIIIADGKHQISVSFTHGETIRFGNLEIIADHFGTLSLFNEGNVSGTVFVEMAHRRSLSLHTILEDSADDGDTTSSGGRSSVFPISRGCNVVTTSIPIITTPPSESTPTPLAIVTVPLQTIMQ